TFPGRMESCSRLVLGAFGKVEEGIQNAQDLGAFFVVCLGRVGEEGARVSFAGRAQRPAGVVGGLPPLSLDAAGSVLVGDPQQWTATVLSQAAGVYSI
ncbi:hypothetical protein KI387_000543, partial [Taxus chinensis]